jgi:hypothetical protein
MKLRNKLRIRNFYKAVLRTIYNNTADVQKFYISRFDGDNQGYEKSRARSHLSRFYRLGNTHLQFSKLSPDAVLPSVVFTISD